MLGKFTLYAMRSGEREAKYERLKGCTVFRFTHIALPPRLLFALSCHPVLLPPVRAHPAFCSLSKIQISPAPNTQQAIPLSPTKGSSSLQTASANPFTGMTPQPIMGLRCFAPEGTPIQNATFPLHNGATHTLGRKQTNTISFSQDVRKTGEVVGLDSSISGCHAHILVKDGKVELHDGEVGTNKASTNGTWLRLSAMHKTSELFELRNGAELLIGTVRFQCVVEEQIVERDFEGTFGSEGAEVDETPVSSNRRLYRDEGKEDGDEERSRRATES